MNVSVYKARSSAGKATAGALPKVNVRPSPPAVSTSTGDTMAAAENTVQTMSVAMPRRKEWDVRFALALIAAVVVVNVTLTVLLGGNGPDTEDAAISMETEASMPGLRDNADDRDTDVFISSEEKRLLLRHLYSEPASGTAEARNPEEQGTYRSLSAGGEKGLSIIGATPSAGR